MNDFEKTRAILPIRDYDPDDPDTWRITSQEVDPETGLTTVTWTSGDGRVKVDPGWWQVGVMSEGVDE